MELHVEIGSLKNYNQTIKMGPNSKFLEEEIKTQTCMKERPSRDTRQIAYLKMRGFEESEHASKGILDLYASELCGNKMLWFKSFHVRHLVIAAQCSRPRKFMQRDAQNLYQEVSKVPR